MCGIVCIIKKIQNKSSNKYKALQSIQDRGPDDFGKFEDKNVTLIHTRLAIRNTDYSGVQPYIKHTPNGNQYVLIFNGEIYNVKYLAEKYQNITSNCAENELILQLYIAHKQSGDFANVINNIDGIFSFIIYDIDIQKLIIVRDAFGVKPLFVYENKEHLLFTSNVKAILSINQIDLSKNLENIQEFFCFRQCLNDKTIIRDINKFPAGHLGIYNFKEKTLTQNKYFKYTIDQNDNNQHYMEIHNTQHKLNNAIVLNCLKDKHIKFGCFLSGGVDSSYIYKVCEKIADVENFYSYSIGFEHANEFEFANKVVNYKPKNKIKHTNITVTVKQYFEEMIKLIENKGYPLNVPNETMIAIIAKAAKKDGLKVLLAGEGADEVFHGYGRIFNLFLKPNTTEFIKEFVNEYKYIKNNNIFTTNNSQQFQSYFNQFLDSEKHKQDIIGDIFIKFHIQGLTNRLDSASMMHSIEARVPFLTQSFVKHVYNNITIDQKIKRTYDIQQKTYTNYKDLSETRDTPKHILKKIAEELLPQEIIYRKKVGFPVPIEDIDNPVISKIIRNILTKGSILKLGIFNIQQIEQEIEQKSKNLKYIIFNLINIEIFIQLFHDNKTVEQIRQFLFPKVIGYTCGVYDLFHVGHVNILKRAKEQCDYLIVAVTTDEKVIYKGKTAAINQNDRKKIVENCQYVDKVIFQEDHDKFKAWKQIKYDKLFVGDDWKGHANWVKWENQLKEVGAQVVYFPYTQTISTTKIKNQLKIMRT